MPSRRALLRAGGIVVTAGLAGCSALQDEPRPVNVLLQNDDDREWPLTVAVERDGEELFRTEETVPADDGTGLGEVRIEDAFEGTDGEGFTVRAWLDGDPAGTFEYTVTCPEDNRFSLLVEHDATTGDALDYVARRCGE
ncbi:hypothetical protein [Haloglomus litoreum]|uniref:hypothetical protein n=1 Tax=Haloglomus litoreum TaxID=3034026 RepID=UPI0023E8FB6B|nr:hypothetical protein [Haloglomus sp. DT116]